MDVLVTGSDGYIGSNLVPKLRVRGNSVIPFDIVNDFRRDIRNVERLKLEMSDCDAIIHLAGLSGIDQCDANPMKAVEINASATANIAILAHANDKKLVFASSFAADNPLNIYGLTKRLAELVVLRESGIVLRLSNVWGGRSYLEKKNSVVAYLMKMKLQGSMAQIHRDGSQSRDFIHVRDVCGAFIEALNAPPGIYNVCTGTQTSVLELTRMIGVPFEFIDNPRVMVKPTIPDLPGWGPVTRFDRELAKEIKENASTWHPSP